MSPRFNLGPKPRLGYVESKVERAAERRDDAAYLAALQSDRGSLHYVIGGELVILKRNGGGFEAAFSADEVLNLGAVTEAVFLGMLGAGGCFGIGLPEETTQALQARADLHVTDLRSIAVRGLVAADDLAPIAEAKAVLHWHARHRCCANCGAATQSVHGG